MVISKSPVDLSYDEIIQKVGEYFTPKPSEIIQRFKFNKRSQIVSESVANYVADLRRLSEHCGFGTTLDSMLRDRLVYGIADEAIQRRLLAEADLTFQKALDIAITAETARKNALDLRASSTYGTSTYGRTVSEEGIITRRKRFKVNLQNYY